MNIIKPDISKQDSSSGDCDAFFHWMISSICNLNCDYCFASKKLRTNEQFDFPVVEKFFLEQDKRYLIALSSDGEPFLNPSFLKLCQLLTRKHLIVVHSNLSIQQETLQSFIDKVSSDKVCEVVASFHFKELKRMSLIQRFEENLETLRKHGFSTRIILVAHPELEREISFYSKHFQSSGYHTTVMPFYGTYHKRKYPESYSIDDMKKLQLDHGKADAYFSKGKVCNAGYNVGFIHNNSILSCCDVYQPLGSFKEGVSWNQSLIRCPSDRCSCPYFFYFTNLLNKGDGLVPINLAKFNIFVWKIKYRVRVLINYLKKFRRQI